MMTTRRSAGSCIVFPNSVMLVPSDEPPCATLSHRTISDGLARRANHQSSAESLVYPLDEKYFAFPEMQISRMVSHPVPARGAYRDRHGRGAWDAMDAAARRTSAADRGRRNRVVPIPRRWDQACGQCRRRRWLSSPVHRREHCISRITIAQGMPACFGVPVVTTRVLSTLAHEAAGAACIRHSLRPLFGEGHA
jgi:hypothetical protein